MFTCLSEVCNFLHYFWTLKSWYRLATEANNKTCLSRTSSYSSSTIHINRFPDSKCISCNFEHVTCSTQALNFVLLKTPAHSSLMESILLSFHSIFNSAQYVYIQYSIVLFINDLEILSVILVIVYLFKWGLQLPALFLKLATLPVNGYEALQISNIN